MQSPLSPLQEPSHTVPSLVVRADRVSYPPLQSVRTHTPRPGSASAQVCAPSFQSAGAPARLTCLRVAYLGTLGQAEKEAQHLQSPNRPHDSSGG